MSSAARSGGRGANRRAGGAAWRRGSPRPAHRRGPGGCCWCWSGRARAHCSNAWGFDRGALMDEKALTQLLKKVKGGKLTVDDAVHQLKDLPFAALGYATVDTHRSLRFGFPEVVLGEPK